MDISSRLTSAYSSTEWASSLLARPAGTAGDRGVGQQILSFPADIRPVSC